MSRSGRHPDCLLPGTRRRPYTCLLALALSTCLEPQAWAQSAETGAASTPGTPNATTVLIARVTVEGVGDHPASGISRAAVEGVANRTLREIGPTLPAALDFEQIQQISARITQTYREAGFLVSVAYVPPQDIGDSQTLTLTVLEGRVGRVLVQGSQRYRDDQLTASSLGLIGRPLRRAELDRALLYARDLPGVSVTSILQPGEHAGETDIVLVAQDSAHPYEVTAGLNNHGTDSTGKYRAELGISAFNALGAADVLSASVAYGLDPADSWQGALSLSIPSSAIDGLSLTAGVSRSEIELNNGPFSALEIHGPTTVGHVGLDWKFINRTDLLLQVSSRWIHQESRLDGLGMQLSSHAFDVLEAGLSMRHTDRRLRGINLVQLSTRKSISDESAPFDWLYPNHDSYYWVTRLSAARLQALPGNQRLYLRGTGQFTDNALTPMEQFSVGGPNSVRAFPLSAALGDRGVQATFEYQVDAPGFATLPSPFQGRNWGDVVSFQVFYDWGRTSPVAQNRRLGLQPITLEGAGLGLQLRLPQLQGLQFNLTASTPTGRTQPTDQDDMRVWAGISLTF